MIKKFTFIFICSFVLISCNFNSSYKAKLNAFKETGISTKGQVPSGFIPRNLTIVSAGDSLTQGVGDSTEHGGYLPYLEEKLEYEKGIKDAKFYNFGVRGNRSEQLLKKMKTSPVRKAVQNADVVILTVGGNDVMKVVRENFSGLELKAFKQQKMIYEENLKEVLNTVREDNPNSIIVLVGLYNPFLEWFSDIKEINQIMEGWNSASRGILSQYPGTYFVEIDDIFRHSEENLLYSDYFHPNNRGYELIAGRIYETFKDEVLNQLSENIFSVGNGEIRN